MVEYEVYETSKTFLLVEYFSLLRKSKKGLDLKTFLKDIEGDDPMSLHQKVIIAKKLDKLIGFSTLLIDKNGTANLPMIAVAKDLTNQGIGTELFLLTIKEALKVGKKRLNIPVEPTYGGKDFFIRFGAKVVSTVPYKLPDGSIVDNHIYRIRDLEEVYKNFKGEEIKNER